MLHISAFKSVHICKFATVTMHTCTVIVALVFNKKHFFLSLLHLTLTSLSFYLSLNPSISPSIPPQATDLTLTNLTDTTSTIGSL